MGVFVTLACDLSLIFEQDSPMKGSQYWTKASPLLAHLVQQTAQEIVHPNDSSRSLWDATTDVGSFHGSDAEMRKVEHLTPQVRPGLEKVGALGSGSDYTVFLQRIGVCISISEIPLVLI